MIITDNSLLYNMQKFDSMPMVPLARLWVDLDEARQLKTESISTSVNDLIYLT